MKFKIKDESNVEREACVVTAFENDGHEYIIYSIDRDEKDANVFVSRLEKNSEGKNVLVDINDAEEKNKVNSIVNDIVGLPVVGDV